MWVLEACRCCLTTEGKLDAIDTVTARSFFSIVGINISSSDGYPTCICYECKAYLKKAMAFRRKVKRADFVLKEIFFVRRQITIADIKTVDRERTNLKTNLIKSFTLIDSIEPELKTSEEDKIKREKEIEDVINDIKMDTTEIEDIIDDNTDVGVDMTVDNEEVFDVDLEDVFKGLKEPSESELDSPDEEEEPDNEVQEKEPVKDSKKDITPSIKRAAELLFRSKIRHLSLDEQKQAFKKRMEAPSFKSALFKCGVCVKTFKNTEEIKAHCLYHSKRKNNEHFCLVCMDRYKTETALSRHCMMYHWYAYKCFHCKTEHTTFEDLKQCTRYLTFIKPAKCEQVPMYIKKTILKPQQVYKITKPNTGLYKCTKCDMSYEKAKYLTAHIGYHDDVITSKVYCDICKMGFKSRMHLGTHLQNFHTYKYSCRKCHAVYYYHSQARAHSKKCKAQPTYLSCDKCDKYIRGDMRVHVLKKHSKHCAMCGEMTDDLKELWLHQLHEHKHIRLNTVVELNDPRYYCLGCKVYFCDEKAYFRHLCIVHLEEAKSCENGCVFCRLLFDSAEEKQLHDCPLLKFHINKYKECKKCREVFRVNEDYLMHLLEKHPGEPLVTPPDTVCDQCGKMIAVGCFKSHMQSHQRDILLSKCKFCPFRTTIKMLVQHMVSSHTYRPFLCTKCPRRFKTRCQCRDHILKIHAPVLAYRCEVCSLRFAHLDFLHEHCVKIHRVDLKKTDRSVFVNSLELRDKLFVYPHMKIDGSLVPPEYFTNLEVYSCDYMEDNVQVIDIAECFSFDPDVDPNTPTKNANPKKKSVASKKTYKKTRAKNRLRRKFKEYLTNNNFDAIIQMLSKYDINELDPDHAFHTSNPDKFQTLVPRGYIEQSDKEDCKPKPVKKGKTAVKENDSVEISAPSTSDVLVKKPAVFSYVVEEKKHLKNDLNKEAKVSILHMPDLNESFENNIKDSNMHMKVETDELSEIKDVEIETEQVETETKDEMEVDQDMENVTGELIEQDGQYYVLIDGNLFKVEETEQGFVLCE